MSIYCLLAYDLLKRSSYFPTTYSLICLHFFLICGKYTDAYPSISYGFIFCWISRWHACFERFIHNFPRIVQPILHIYVCALWEKRTVFTRREIDYFISRQIKNYLCIYYHGTINVNSCEGSAFQSNIQ